VRRTLASPEEAWGLAALGGAVWVAFKDRRGPGAGIGPSTPGWPLLLPLAAYAALHPWMPPLLRATLALLSLAAWLPRLGVRPRAALHAAGFLLLSLPVIPSLQFFLGYPLRVLAGGGAAFLLNLAGYGVVREGSMLAWGSRSIFVDAPCSGVKMLWAGILLALVLAARRGAGLRATTALLAIGILAVTAGNALRAAALFHVETGLLGGPAWTQPHVHATVGLTAFLGAACLLLAWDGRSRA
jgi:exosortase